MSDLYEKTKKPGEFFLVTRYLSRPLTYPLAVMFRLLGFSPNAVTVLGGLAWVASIVTIVLAGMQFQAGQLARGWALLVLTAALWNFGYVLDVVDGSLARMTGRASAAGSYLDFVFHLLFQPMHMASVGAFLYMVTLSPVFILLALLAICANWGVASGGREHVLCEEIALGKADPGKLSPEDRYDVFIDSPKIKASTEDKQESASVLLHLVQEAFTFPGIFAALALVVLLDLVTVPWLGHSLWFLKTFFVAHSVVMVSRVPFRIRREYRAMRKYDALQDDES